MSPDPDAGYEPLHPFVDLLHPNSETGFPSSQPADESLQWRRVVETSAFCHQSTTRTSAHQNDCGGLVRWIVAARSDDNSSTVADVQIFLIARNRSILSVSTSLYSADKQWWDQYNRYRWNRRTAYNNNQNL